MFMIKCDTFFISIFLRLLKKYFKKFQDDSVWTKKLEVRGGRQNRVSKCTKYIAPAFLTIRTLLRAYL